MSKLKIMSLNGEDMIDLVPKDLSTLDKKYLNYWRARRLAQFIKDVNPDIIGLVEAPPDQPRTEKYVEDYLDGEYKVYQGEKRGMLGLAFLVRADLNIKVIKRSKAQSLKDFKLDAFDADGDGIKEKYSWWNRVPLEATFSGDDLPAKTVFILIHSKSKGAFIPGDLYAYEKLSRANRMKLKAQASAVRNRLDKLIDERGRGRVIVLGDMNDGPEFDIYAAMLGGAFLEPVMGSIWAPNRILHNCHENLKKEYRWTIDFKDRVVNPLGRSRYGQPSELRSWIDHILVSPELKNSVVQNTARIYHKKPKVQGMPSEFAKISGTDHHPPYVILDL